MTRSGGSSERVRGCRDDNLPSSDKVMLSYDQSRSGDCSRSRYSKDNNDAKEEGRSTRIHKDKYEMSLNLNSFNNDDGYQNENKELFSKTWNFSGSKINTSKGNTVYYSNLKESSCRIDLDGSSLNILND